MFGVYLYHTIFEYVKNYNDTQNSFITLRVSQCAYVFFCESDKLKVGPERHTL